MTGAQGTLHSFSVQVPPFAPLMHTIRGGTVCSQFASTRHIPSSSLACVFKLDESLSDNLHLRLSL